MYVYNVVKCVRFVVLQKQVCMKVGFNTKGILASSLICVCVWVGYVYVSMTE